MKTFGYSCRDNSGALKKGTLRAIDRTDALLQIKTMDCIPISVTEGKGETTSSRMARIHTGRNTIIYLVVAIVVLIVAMVEWRIVHQNPVAKNQPIATFATKPLPKNVYSTPQTNQTVKTVQAVPRTVPAPPTSHKDDAPQTAIAKTPTSRETITPEPETEMEPQTKRSSPYKSATEQLLAMAMSVPPGARIPPLPIAGNLDKDFANSLTNTIVIYDDDDANTVSMKENVAAAKMQLLEAVKQGRSVAEVLQEYQNSANEKISARNEALQELTALYQSGKPEEAQAYLEKINKAFNDLGIAPISPPIHSKP
jgi:peptidyl-tRNA hydrolase